MSERLCVCVFTHACICVTVYTGNTERVYNVFKFLQKDVFGSPEPK